MKVLLVNKYLYPKGGDAISTLNVGRLLINKGHDVVFWGMKHVDNPEYPYSEYFINNIDYNNGNNSDINKISNALKILYSFEAKHKIKKLIKIIKPDIVHLNNFAHQISPSILHIFKKYNIPVVMTMHDYKLVCASYSMLSEGKVCEGCANDRYYNCVVKRCVKNSYLRSFINTLEMYLHHKLLNIYRLIDIYISPSQFLKDKVKQMGFKGNVEILHNFIDLSEFVPDYSCGAELCYFGRLSKEKGLNTLINAVANLDIKLKIIGTGPSEDQLKKYINTNKINNIVFLGYKTGDDFKNEIKKSMAVIVPSECYENNPFTILESFALGKPVIGSRMGGIPELVKDDITGYTFEAGNIQDLREKITKIMDNRDKVVQMGKCARKFIEDGFNSELHYKKLMNIYEKTMLMGKKK